MKTPIHPVIRGYLRKNTNGATLHEIAERNGLARKSVRNALMGMPDAYIDRWAYPVRGQYQAVWCVVVPPPNCPHPDDRHVHTNWDRKFFVPADARMAEVARMSTSGSTS